MLGLGWTEMLVIGVVALIVIGPKDLPMVMGKIGKVIGQVQRMGREFQREINRTTGLDEVRNLRNSITSPLKQTADEIRREFNTMTPTGPQPSGALKPADPKAESVVNEIREKAGMAPAKKSSTEMAAEYGFKPTAQEPVKAARPTSAKPKSEAVEPAAKPAKPKTAAKPATAKATPAAKRAKAKTEPKPETAAEVAKPVAKPAARKPRIAAASTAEAAPAPAKKPRAPKKKPADTAGKSE